MSIMFLVFYLFDFYISNGITDDVTFICGQHKYHFYFVSKISPSQFSSSSQKNRFFGLFKYLHVNYLLCDLNAHIHSYSVIAKSVTLWLQISGLTFELSAVNGGGVGSCTQCRTLRPCQSRHTQCKYYSLKRRLSECSRRFHNHGEGPY